jgi:hypothetical protein
VRVAYSVDVDDFYRRALRHHFGDTGLATRRQVQEWQRQHGAAEDDDLIFDLQQAIERGDVDPVT